MYTSTTFVALALAATTLAKTDLAGCTSTTVGASIEYYVPGTGELCSILDCGGGRAPPKTDVPGCAAYVGTATYQPSFLPGYNAASATGAASSVASSVEAQSTAYETAPAASTAVAYSSTLASITSLIVTGTGSPSVVPSGGNNLTASATLSSTGGVPESTGAANALAVAGSGLLGLAAGVVGLALL